MQKDVSEIVRTVVPGGPAAQAGLQQGDLILKVNGQSVTPEQTVSYLVANTRVGSKVPLEIIRAGRRQTVYVTVGERPTEEQLARIGGSGGTTEANTTQQPVTPQKALGLSLAPLTPELARAANLPATARGVIVTAVDPNSDASDEGLQRGDLIISVNGSLVTTPAQLVAAVDAARKAGRPSVLLLVKRGNSPEAFVGVDISGR
jgi:serine protease Do